MSFYPRSRTLLGRFRRGAPDPRAPDGLGVTGVINLLAGRAPRPEPDPPHRAAAPSPESNLRGCSRSSPSAGVGPAWFPGAGLARPLHGSLSTTLCFARLRRFVCESTIQKDVIESRDGGARLAVKLRVSACDVVCRAQLSLSPLLSPALRLSSLKLQ